MKDTDRAFLHQAEAQFEEWKKLYPQHPDTDAVRRFLQWMNRRTFVQGVATPLVVSRTPREDEKHELETRLPQSRRR